MAHGPNLGGQEINSAHEALTSVEIWQEVSIVQKSSQGADTEAAVMATSEALISFQGQFH